MLKFGKDVKERQKIKARQILSFQAHMVLKSQEGVASNIMKDFMHESNA